MGASNMGKPTLDTIRASIVPKGLCAPCYQTLKELCNTEKDAQVCELFEGYTETGDQRFFDRATELVGGKRIVEVQRSLRERGLIRRGGKGHG